MTEPFVPAVPSSDGPFPQQLGRYRLDQCLGAGSHGTVYRAFDITLRTPVAVKIPKEQVRQNPLLLERFYREARAGARLRQESNICQILDVGDHNGVPFLTMQLIDGRPLPVGTPWEPFEAARLVWKLARALWKVHGRGIVHRDLKPDNVLIDGSGEPTITDFGVALLLDPEELRRTEPGTIIGSWYYLAPEQMDGAGPTGVACDVYSLGVILYELLVGRPPFVSGSITALIRMVQNDEPPAPRELQRDLNPALEAVCLRALAKQPSDRFADTWEFANALAPHAGQELLARPTAAASPPFPLLRPEQIHFVFCGVGEVAPPRLRPGFLYLDVGNGLRSGVIDHHHLRLAGTCTTCLVRQHANYVDAAIPQGPDPDRRFTIILHEDPDMDAVAAAYLVRDYLTTGQFPRDAGALVEYVARIDEGSLGFSLSRPFSLYSAYNQLCNRFLMGPFNSKAERWQALVRAGLDLIGHVLAQVAERGVAIQDVDAFGCPDWFSPPDREDVTADLRRYDRKLADPSSHPRRARLSLPDGDGQRAEVPALLVRDVQNVSDPGHCRFFRDWARADTQRSGSSSGFVGLSVFHNEGDGQRRRCILSVPPGRGVTLRGLGERLDQAEAAKRRAIYGVDDRVEDPVTGAAKVPRPGFGNSDPWYDGRGHDDTIVDSPRSGTLLTADEIEAIFLDFGQATDVERMA
jgi:hypothetical protein